MEAGRLNERITLLEFVPEKSATNQKKKGTYVPAFSVWAEVKCTQSTVTLDGDGVLSFGGLRAHFDTFNAATMGEQDVTVGIRPEYVRIEKDGALEATVYSTLPSGMETTVKLDVNGLSLTSVVFGDVDFPVDKKVRFSFNKATVLFDRESGQTIARGSLTML